MSFLAPVWLLLAVAAAVPLLLHLLKRKIDLKVDFPAVRYLLRAKQDNRNRLRVQNLILMALRMAAILLIAAAAARPIGWLGGTGHLPTALAIVLDNSLSTSIVVDGAPLVERLRDEARALVRGATSSDRLWLVTADGRVVGGDAGTILDAIERSDVFPGQGDLPAAVTRAASLVRSAQLPGERIAVVTDGQATAWQRGVDVGPVPLVAYLPGGDAPANRAVVLADARPSRWTPNGTVVLRTNGWGAGGDSATYRVALGDRTLARGTVRANEETVVRAAPPERGWQSGSAEIAPDELRGDDTRYFAVWLGDPPRVRLDPSAGPFVQTAVTALAGINRIALGTDIDVAGADGGVRLPALLTAPLDPVRLGAANRALERLGIPWRFGARRAGESVARGERMDGVSVTLRYQLQLEGTAPTDTLATVAGEPWIVAGDRYVLVGSPLVPTATSSPIAASFVPWLGDILAQQLGGEAGRVIALTPGAEFRAPQGTTALQSAEGQDIPLDAAAPRAPMRQGVYFLRRGPVRIGALTVNAEPDESDLRRLDQAALAARLRGRDVAVLRDAGAWRNAAFAVGNRRPLGTILLVLLLLVIAAETLVARSGLRRLRRT
ncbi:MAG TPA: BatA and WFA domain-containing protein [Gemmatimonadaceae bacterium]|nr:BatA and WFA domain-containing protein [Gemmatimonadaceae bacterium]